MRFKRSVAQRGLRQPDTAIRRVPELRLTNAGIAAINMTRADWADPRDLLCVVFVEALAKRAQPGRCEVQEMQRN